MRQDVKNGGWRWNIENSRLYRVQSFQNHDTSVLAKTVQGDLTRKRKEEDSPQERDILILREREEKRKSGGEVIRIQIYKNHPVPLRLSGEKKG